MYTHRCPCNFGFPPGNLEHWLEICIGSLKNGHKQAWQTMQKTWFTHRSCFGLKSWKAERVNYSCIYHLEHSYLETIIRHFYNVLVHPILVFVGLRERKEKYEKPLKYSFNANYVFLARNKKSNYDVLKSQTRIHRLIASFFFFLKKNKNNFSFSEIIPIKGKVSCVFVH